MRFWLMSKDDCSSCAILCCLVKMLSFNHPLRISKEGKTCVTDTLFVRFSNMAINDQYIASDCESSCPCYCSQIEGLGLHVVSITRYVIRIKKHWHNWNRKAIIEIDLKRAVKFNIPFNCEARAVPAGKWFVVMQRTKRLYLQIGLKSDSNV